MKVLNEIKMEYPNLNKVLYNRIKRYLNYNKSEYNNNLKFILESLPSSLQNNLIIEIYKPIIKNFQFFKSFENSDFFVKIVTSLKPILSMKDDILVQEGDVIEDIIFIKKGVLSLEICIDLDCPQESCEAHLNMNGFAYTLEQTHTVKSGKGYNSQTINSSNINYTRNSSKVKNEIKKLNKKQMNIINLRKNEHYGDILMILNERSPLTVKVKSKKAELFFLQKTDATEISNKYPNIWKRIVHKSLYNMKQIKQLIKKKLLYFVI
jgi:CRP-like cAMP-binding protein